MSLATDPIAVLGEEHRAHGTTFLRHQEALLERRLAEAASLLEAYEHALLCHIAFEERHVCRTALARAPPGGRAKSTGPSTGASGNFCARTSAG